jgi:hypothetical protein
MLMTITATSLVDTDGVIAADCLPIHTVSGSSPVNVVGKFLIRHGVSVSDRCAMFDSIARK